MRHALALARRGLGRVWPNPAVGCVIVAADGVVVGRGHTQPGGRPHAETVALAQAGPAARGADVYVSLEPCAHHGQTPPCAEALVAAGVRRVVVACTDPDSRVAGQGLEILRKAGIAVEVGVCECEAVELNAGFMKRVTEGLPLVTLKLATSLDGRMATAQGQSKWITGPAAREYGHRLRSEHDAILVGRRTAAADDPELTCRLPGLHDRSPVRVVLDSGLTLPHALRLFATAKAVPTWVVASAGVDPARVAALSALGVEVLLAPDSPDGLSLVEVMLALAGRGITRVLVEGGAAVATGLLKAGLVDRLAWFRAPKVIGGDGRAAVGGLDVAALSQAMSFERREIIPLGQDVLETFVTSR